ncbi:type IV toxin-antitoxin system AbiEi family antitoxin domain-containing protein [Pseudonocardia alni]|uniref:type IV toxin-antitoxin system AbiEi family antitoxin domain-containing protein n=1 Tax=Pseudonocardia alni TaxID=33907 RepID=UPI0034043842
MTELERLLVRQGGLVTRAQAIAYGVPARTVARRVSSGTWRERFPGVYLVAGHRVTAETRVRAAWLWGGARSVVTGSAAAYWLGLRPGAPAEVVLAVPSTVQRARRPGVRLRRRTLDPADRVVHRGIVVTAAPLTVLETSAVLPDAAGAAFLDRALQRWVSFGELHAAYCRVAGTPGIAAAARLLVAAGDRADSALERRLLRLLREARLPGLVRAVPFGPWTIDLAFPAVQVAVEVDGWAWHSDPERFRTDRRKQNALVAAGWTVLRFTWSDVHDRPGETVGRIRRAVGDRAA